MCGIAGILNLDETRPPSEQLLRGMLGMIRHRGPDEFGIYLDEFAGLGNARLSIIDLSGGQQPISNEDGTLWVVFNGEIFNYLELRPELEARGHRFKTHCDTEVLLHLYEEFGPQFLERLNGQFAFAIWNSRDRSLFLARDRLGVRPLFYTHTNGKFVFGSEIKVLLAHPEVRAEMDPASLDQVFTYWGTLPPRTVFRDIYEIPPGHCLRIVGGTTTIRSYWQLDFPDSTGRRAPDNSQQELASRLEQFSELLIDAARIRLRADVPVGAYLSGGLDSSIIASVIRKFTSNRLDTFSIAFNDTQFDESAFQRRMADALGTSHHVVQADATDIGRVFPDVIWHTEVPLMRTSPAPMFMLARLVRETGFKVVLTGEGADEFLAGYDIFKEAKIRRFWASQPNSRLRPLLFKRIYPDIAGLTASNPTILAAFFRENLTETDHPAYSHAVRWRNNRRTCRLFSAAVREEIAQSEPNALEAQLPPAFNSWDPLARAQCLEIKTFLSPYLLSSQGDRVAMAQSIEGRFPFLDFRLVEFCNRLPSGFKLRGLTEKFLLKQLGKRWLPDEIWRRPKRPYRAPIHRSFFHKGAPEYVRELLTPESLKKSGLFDPAAVRRLVSKAEQGTQIGETDQMALVGILSAQLVHHHFVHDFKRRAPLRESDPVKVCTSVNASESSSLPASVHKDGAIFES